MKALITVLLLIFGERGLEAQETNAATVFDALGDRGREISSRLAAYDQNKDYAALSQVPILLARMTSTNRMAGRAILLAHLEVLGRCLSDRDEAFDPAKAGVFINSAMPPEDPVGRKKYDERMAENERLRDRVNRSVLLKRAGDQSLFASTILLKASVNARDSKTLEAATNAIAHKIKDPRMKDKLFQIIADASKELQPASAR